MGSDADRTEPGQGAAWSVLVPALVALVALVVGGYLAWLTIFRPAGSQTGVESQGTRLTARTVVNRVGGYTLAVPTGMRATKRGQALSLLDARRGLSVTVTTIGAGAPREGNAAVLTAMRAKYASVQVSAVQQQRVDGRRAYATYGTAVSRQGQSLPFLLVTVKGAAKNFAMSAFAGPGADPAQARPRFLAVVGGFRVGVPPKK